MKTFYNPQQSFQPAQPLFSPSMYKPEHVIAHWRRDYPALEIESEFEPVSREQLYAVHDRTQIDGVLALTRPNGFGTTDSGIAQTLPWTSGSFLAAAQYAWRHQTITCSPTSGFHHAGFDYASGFCTFNGLAVAFHRLLQLDPALRIAIVDLDMHYGDGTDDILTVLKMGQDQVQHYTLGGDRHVREGQLRDQPLIEHLTAVLEPMFENEPGLIFYQAGADSHEEDPLGGVFSTNAYRERDRLVFSLAASRGIPIVWNLAGGYQTPLQKVLDLHSITLQEALAVERSYGTEKSGY